MMFETKIISTNFLCKTCYIDGCSNRQLGHMYKHMPLLMMFETKIISANFWHLYSFSPVCIKLLCLTHIIGTFTNSEDPDEMPHHAAFHQGLHFLLNLKNHQTKKNFFFKLQLDTPRYLQWTIPSLSYQTSRKNQPVDLFKWTTWTHVPAYVPLDDVWD